MPVFYKPDVGWLADVIPFYWQGEYHLFYLKDYRDPAQHGDEIPWFHVSTRDFVHFTDYGEALPSGGPQAQNLKVFTGSVFEHNGLFHIFYTGHNPHFPAAGKFLEGVMHATSTDLITWQKDDAFTTLFPDTARYEADAWRDPFIFQDPDTGEFWMLLTARSTTGPKNRRGITALLASPDLVRWEIREPFYAPSLDVIHECSDLFKMGDWWYYVYSTWNMLCVGTQYRMSRSLSGPWIAPTGDTFDSRAFYAAKTASDGQRRFIFGWNPTRSGDSDGASWNWGGHLVVHEIIQQPDGALTVRIPPEVRAALVHEEAARPQPRLGDWKIDAGAVSVDAPGHFAWCPMGEMGQDACLIETTVQFTAETRHLGIVFRADESLDSYYHIRLEPGRNRAVFDRWPRPGEEPPIERHVVLPANTPIHLQLLVEGSVIEAYIADTVALSMRGYDLKAGGYGLFVSEGAAAFTGIRVRKLPASR